MIDVSRFVGLSKDEAVHAITEAGLKVRVSSVQGAPQLLTCDYRLDRVNIEVQDGKVVHASIG